MDVGCKTDVVLDFLRQGVLEKPSLPYAFFHVPTLPWISLHFAGASRSKQISTNTQGVNLVRTRVSARLPVGARVSLGNGQPPTHPSK